MGEAIRRREQGAIEMVGLIGAKSCRNCEFRLKLPQQPAVLMCRRYPPQVVVMPIPDPRANGQWGVNGFYPHVNPDWPCGEYVRSDSGVAEELAESVKGITAQ
jgi:hypothetical protein